MLQLDKPILYGQIVTPKINPTQTHTHTRRRGGHGHCELTALPCCFAADTKSTHTQTAAADNSTQCTTRKNTPALKVMIWGERDVRTSMSRD